MVERGFLGPVFESSTDVLLRHLSTVFGLMPKRFDSLDPSSLDYRSTNCLRRGGVAMEYLSHNASLLSDDNNVPEICGTLQLVSGSKFGLY